MAIGDDALAAGMALVPGTLPANQIDTEENRTRDYIAQRTNLVQPIAKGGTGSTSAPAARTALGLTAMAVADPAAYVPNLNVGVNAIGLRWAGGRVFARIDVTDKGLALDGECILKSGDTMTGDLFLPASSAAISGYTVCYINSDGRVSRGVSAAKYKKFIHDAPDLGNLFPTPLREWTMRANGLEPASNAKHVGYIADELVGTDAERFVVRIDGEVESIDFIALLLAQVHQLHERDRARDEREREQDIAIESLLSRVETLENAS